MSAYDSNIMSHTHPQDVAYWDIDEETEEVEDMGSYTNYPDANGW